MSSSHTSASCQTSRAASLPTTSSCAAYERANDGKRWWVLADHGSEAVLTSRAISSTFSGTSKSGRHPCPSGSYPV